MGTTQLAELEAEKEADLIRPAAKERPGVKRIC